MSHLIALDLGTTRIKGARLDAAGRLRGVIARDAPRVAGDDARRESSAEAYLEAATAVRDELLGGVSGPVTLGLASQRSSFAIWDARSGEARTPLISWQDRRAAAWCARHAADEPQVRRLTGLPLSPHYAGPKLATLIEEDPGLGTGLADGTLRVGTLDTWLLWCWSAGRVHETDHTMAARTLLADARSGRWHPDLLRLCGVPAAALPVVAVTCGRATALDGRITVAATIGDQPAGALAALGDRTDAVLVNLGTGGFVLRPTGRTFETVPGYLSGPILSTTDGCLFALEGTINGAGAALDRFGTPPTDLADADPAPEAFALPDDAGVGAPHWRSDLRLTLSDAAQRLDTPGQRRTVAEGIVFRVRETIDDLAPVAAGLTVRLSGGLSRDPYFGAALAACLDRPVEVLEQGEQTLRGAAWLAAGRSFALADAGPLRRVAPAAEHGWLREKYPRWRAWLGRMLG